jgi:hypothetical protein
MKIKVEESGWNAVGLDLSSGCGEYAGCKLTLKIPRKYIYFRLPQWLMKPVREFKDLSHYVVDGVAPDWLRPNAEGTYGYWELHERRYGFTYADRALHVHYGKQIMEWPGCKSKVFFLPWLEWRHVRSSLLNLDGSFYADVTSQKFGEGERLQDTQPSVSFQFADYDGEVITAKCRIEEREWRAGTGLFKWLSLFRKPKVHRSLDLDFSSEVGRRKGSWKGGTTGHSTEIAPGEAPITAFARYCAEHELTLQSEPVT